jgi:hypothetical protein
MTYIPKLTERIQREFKIKTDNIKFGVKPNKKKNLFSPTRKVKYQISKNQIWYTKLTVHIQIATNHTSEKHLNI